MDSPCIGSDSPKTSASDATTDPLEAALDLMPILSHEPDFTQRVCARMQAQGLVRQRKSGWLALWQEWVRAAGQSLAETGAGLKRPAFAALGLGLVAAGAWWSISSSEITVRHSAATATMAGISEVSEVDAGASVSAELLAPEDAEVIEDLDWIVADWQNELWTQEDVVGVF